MATDNTIASKHQLTPLTAREAELYSKHTEHRPVVVEDDPDAQTVWLKVGVQSFQINDYCESEEHAIWMRHMLARALANISPVESESP